MLILVLFKIASHIFSLYIVALFHTLLDITIFSDTTARASAGKFLKVPLLVGSTQNEGDIFIVGAELLSSLGFAPPFVTELGADLQTEVRHL